MKRYFILAVFLLLSFRIGAQAPSTVAQMLSEGNAGVDVSSENGGVLSRFDVLIRGCNGISADSQPLWIVDGAILNPDTDVDIPFWQDGAATYVSPQNFLLGLNPDDIESIEILSDLSATAIYGSLGANGVIIIKTRRSENKAIGLNARAGSTFQKGNSSFIDRYNLTAGDNRNGNSLRLSASFDRLATLEEKSGTGSFRVGFLSRGGKKVQLGVNASASLGDLSQGNVRDRTNGDFDDSSREFRTTNSLFFNLKPGKFFSIRADAGLDYRMKRRYVWYGPDSGYGALMNAAAAISTMSRFQFNVSLKCQYERYFGNNHLVAALCADGLVSNPDYGVLCGYDFFDYSLGAKGINNAANSSTNRSHNWKERIFGAGLSVRYDYAGKFGVSGSFRTDFNPFFGTGPASMYPSVDAFVDVAKLVSAGNGFLSSFAVSGGWGCAGRDSQMPYVWATGLSEEVPYVDRNLRAFYDAATRLRSREWNVGLRFGVFSDRIKLGVKYYSKITGEEFVTYCNGREFGDKGYWKYGSQEELYSETGTIANSGVEMTLDFVPVDRTNVRWELGADAFVNFNLTEKVSANKKHIDGITGSWLLASPESFRGQKIIGYKIGADGNPQDLSGDGILSDADLSIVGNSLPLGKVSVYSNLRLFGLSLKGRVGCRFGGDVVDYEGFLASEDRIFTEKYVRSEIQIPFSASVLYDFHLGHTVLKPYVSVDNGLPSRMGFLYNRHVSLIGGVSFTF